ncbi:putative transcriptional regulator SLK2 [Silene latifolia]|uniref:putative transcriptional regulator SLK2 n=1 Tax=Silene latifolia TaxID=37657 RepID=UPI003D789A8F
MESLGSISGPQSIEQLSPQGPHHFSLPAHQASVSPVMMLKNLRLDPIQEAQVALWHAKQLKCYSDLILASRMLQEKQIPHQLELVPNSRPQEASNVVMNAGLAIRKIQAYVHYRRQRPSDNNILYWRSFVMNFFSPYVQKKTCFSKYALGGSSHSHGIFSQMDTWKCEICESASGKGFVETYDALPRLNQLYFSSGDVVDELLYLEVLKEKTLPDGSLMLRFGKAVQTSIYAHCRVVHEGQLQVIFTPQLKIIAWDFCVQHHEVFLPRKLIVAQANDCTESAKRSKAAGRSLVQEHDSLSNDNGLAAAARKLATTVEQSHVSDLGLSKHFVRSLQVAELFNSMKDLMTCSLNNNTSPIETLKQYGRGSTNPKLETRHVELRSAMQPNSSRLPERRYYLARDAHLTTDYISNETGMHNSPSLIPTLYQSPISPAQRSSGPEQFMINDLLAHIQRDVAKKPRSESMSQRTQKKRRVGNDQVSNGLTTGRVQWTRQLMNRSSGKRGNNKGLNSSCSSNSSRMFPDCNFLKRDPDGDEDYTSPAQTQVDHPW